MHTHQDEQRRRRAQIWKIGLAGYTNVGKSLIVNHLTGSDLLVRDGYFATVDVAARRVQLPSRAECYVLDSVGFVKDLPLDLYDAFQATVEELRAADVVLHVRDMAHPAREEHAVVVLDVLARAGIDVERRVVEVWNKTDLLGEDALRRLRGEQGNRGIFGLAVSALHGEGFDELLEGIDERLRRLDVQRVPGHSSARPALEAPRTRSLRRARIPAGLPAAEAAGRWALLREYGEIVESSIAAECDGATTLEVWMDAASHARCASALGTDISA